MLHRYSACSCDVAHTVVRRGQRTDSAILLAQENDSLHAGVYPVTTSFAVRLIRVSLYGRHLFAAARARPGTRKSRSR